MPAWFTPLKDAARWIWLARTADASPPRSETALFHGNLTPPPNTHSIELHVSAEGRYTLWLNDQADPLGHGPARGDRYHRSVDTYSIDISDNPEQTVAIWSQVRWFAGTPEAPLAEIPGPMPAFLLIAIFLDRAGQVLSKAGTDGSWLATPCTAFSGKRIDIPAYFAIGYTEHQKSSGFPRSWRSKSPPNDPAWQPASPTDPAWQPAGQLAPPYFHRDPDIPWSDLTWLTPREIPHMEYEALPIREIRRVAPGDGLPCGTPDLETLSGIQMGPNESATFRCDLGQLAMAYYRLRLAGKGSALAITSSEVLTAGVPTVETPAQKSFDLDSNLPLLPLTDTFTLDTDHPHTFESSHWRAFRFLELTLTAGPEGGTLESFTLHATGYPFQPDYSFDASSAGDPSVQDTLRKAVDISWRTLKCCTWETYMDCPYYEQIQYIGDTRIQCLITYLTTGDPTLPAQALRAFDRSRIPEGLTQSRYPCNSMQIIPTFSLIYILMIEDYLLHIGDDGLVAELRPGIAPILNWFTQHTDPDTGLIGYVPYWPFIDWVNGWPRGIPPHGIALRGNARLSDADNRANANPFSGSSACVNLFYLLALQSAAGIYERAKPGSGNFYHTRAKALKQRLYDAFYDKARGLVCDIPLSYSPGLARDNPSYSPRLAGGNADTSGGGKGKLGVWSQHAQALAVLADLLSPTEAKDALTIALDPKNILRPDESTADTDSAKAGKFENRFIAPASFYFRFYLAEAIAKLRMGEQFWPLVAPFRDAIARGSTTWPESFEPCRSECHAWSAWPLYFFARHTLGIAPPSPEDSRIRIQPLPAFIRASPRLLSKAPHLNIPFGGERDRSSLTVAVPWGGNRAGCRRVDVVEVVRG